MSGSYAVTVSDEVADELSQYEDERIIEALRNTLEEMASASERQDELHDRMGIEVSDDQNMDDEELVAELQAFMRGERKHDPRL